MRSRHQLLSQPSRIGSQGDHVLNVCDVGVEIGVLADMASVAKPRQSGCRGGMTRSTRPVGNSAPIHPSCHAPATRTYDRIAIFCLMAETIDCRRGGPLVAFGSR
jgi:hypothetical protein